MALLDSEGPSNSILEVIGEANQDCMKVFKYIISSTSTTPVSAVPLREESSSPNVRVPKRFDKSPHSFESSRIGHQTSVSPKPQQIPPSHQV